MSTRRSSLRKEGAAWVLGLAVVLLLGGPLVLWSAGEVQGQPPGLQAQSQALVQVTAPAEAPQRADLTESEGDVPESSASLFSFASSEAPVASSPAALKMPERVLGVAELDLEALARGNSPGEVDNALWSLIRRTPQSAEIYHADTGVDWESLRGIAQVGTILVMAGFPWSFNETFQKGPGYKEASGILAGGHCALATVFRAAAVQAGLPVSSKRHRTPIPGYSLDESVNILWGRDDLIVHNNTEQHLYFVWAITPGKITVAVAPVSDELPLPPLPDWRQATVAMVYGRPGPGGWGSLGETAYVDHALFVTRSFGGRVDQWNGDKPVAVAVNPNVVMAGKVSDKDFYLYHLISEARRQGYYVMLDVQPGGADALTLFENLMEKFLQENVWFDWDVEHTSGGRVTAEQLNQVTAAYAARREAKGLEIPGIFGYYVFKNNQVVDPANVQRDVGGHAVVPIFDGYGGTSSNPAADKIAKTGRILSLFGEGPIGIMEFETRWGTKYDKISARTYFDAYPDTLIFASQ